MFEWLKKLMAPPTPVQRRASERVEIPPFLDVEATLRLEGPEAQAVRVYDIAARGAGVGLATAPKAEDVQGALATLSLRFDGVTVELDGLVARCHGWRLGLAFDPSNEARRLIRRLQAASLATLLEPVQSDQPDPVGFRAGPRLQLFVWREAGAPVRWKMRAVDWMMEWVRAKGLRTSLIVDPSASETITAPFVLQPSLVQQPRPDAEALVLASAFFDRATRMPDELRAALEATLRES